MKKLSKQALLQAQSPAPLGQPLKKKTKTTSTSFTPYNKPSVHSDMQVPMQQRYSIGDSETPLAMNQNIEYYSNAQSSQRLAVNTLHKPSHS